MSRRMFAPGIPSNVRGPCQVGSHVVGSSCFSNTLTAVELVRFSVVFLGFQSVSRPRSSSPSLSTSERDRLKEEYVYPLDMKTSQLSAQKGVF